MITQSHQDLVNDLFSKVQYRRNTKVSPDPFPPPLLHSSPRSLFPSSPRIGGLVRNINGRIADLRKEHHISRLVSNEKQGDKLLKRLERLEGIEDNDIKRSKTRLNDLTKEMKDGHETEQFERKVNHIEIDFEERKTIAKKKMKNLLAYVQESYERVIEEERKICTEGKKSELCKDKRTARQKRLEQSQQGTLSARAAIAIDHLLSMFYITQNVRFVNLVGAQQYLNGQSGTITHYFPPELDKNGNAELDEHGNPKLERYGVKTGRKENTIVSVQSKNIENLIENEAPDVLNQAPNQAHMYMGVDAQEHPAPPPIIYSK